MTYHITEREAQKLASMEMEYVNTLDFGPFDFDLIVDQNEPKDLRAILRACKWVKFRGLVDLGADYHFRINKVLYRVFERKAGQGADFQGSMGTSDANNGKKRIDAGSRMGDQCFKLSLLPIDSSGIYYLHELDHDKENTSGGKDPRWIVGIMTDINIVHGYSSYVTNGVWDTVFHFMKMIGKIHANMQPIWKKIQASGHGPIYYKEEEKVEWEAILAKQKLELESKDITDSLADKLSYLTIKEAQFVNSHHVQRAAVKSQATTFIQMLRAIPGISLSRATAIAPYFTDIYTFLGFLKQTDKKEVIKEMHKIKFIAETVNVNAADYHPSKVTPQSIGPGTVRNLYEFLFVGEDAKMPEKQTRLKKDLTAEGAATKKSKAAPKKRAAPKAKAKASVKGNKKGKSNSKKKKMNDDGDSSSSEDEEDEDFLLPSDCSDDDGNGGGSNQTFQFKRMDEHGQEIVE